MVGSSSFDTTLADSNLKLHATYDLTNAGDETARDVFPTLRIGEWGWSGDPRVVEKGGKASWIIDALIPLKQLGCAHADTCASESQSQRGVFPILVRNHYSDLNGYKFTAPQVIPLLVGSLTPRETVLVHEPELQVQLEVRGDGQRFNANLSLHNMTEHRRSVSVSGFSSQEMSVLSPSQTVSLAPKGDARLTFSVQNFSGTIGSSYPIFAVIEWDEDGMRNLVTAVANVSVARAEQTNTFILIGIGALLLLAVWRHFYRRARRA